MKMIALAVKTTGITPTAGSRLLEFSCMELRDQHRFGNVLFKRVNPGIKLSAKEEAILYLTNSELAEYQTFGDVADELVSFVKGSQLIIHDAPSALGYIDHEFSLLGKKPLVEAYTSVIDTLMMANHQWPDASNVLMNLRVGLNKFMGPDNSFRDVIFTTELHQLLTQSTNNEPNSL